MNADSYGYQGPEPDPFDSILSLVAAGAIAITILAITIHSMLH